MQSVFGYPNDEAYWIDPRGAVGDGRGYGFYEVLSSTWPERLIAYNRHAFPDSTPSHYSSLRHFFIGCHEASGEFLARDLKVEITDGSYQGGPGRDGEPDGGAGARMVSWRESGVPGWRCRMAGSSRLGRIK